MPMNIGMASQLKAYGFDMVPRLTKECLSHNNLNRRLTGIKSSPLNK